MVVGGAMKIENEGAPVPGLHLIIKDMLGLFSSAEIGPGRLVGDQNRVTRTGLFQRDQTDLKLCMLMNGSMDMMHEIKSCPAWNGLSKS